VWFVFFWLQDFASPPISLSKAKKLFDEGQLHKYTFKDVNFV
jgi:hypothetical protein